MNFRRSCPVVTVTRRSSPLVLPVLPSLRLPANYHPVRPQPSQLGTESSHMRSCLGIFAGVSKGRGPRPHSEGIVTEREARSRGCRLGPQGRKY